VQPALAIGLLVVAALGERMLDERPGRRELTAVCAIVAELFGIAALAPDRTTQHVHGVALVLVLTLLAAAATGAVRRAFPRPVDRQSDDDRRRPRIAWGAL